MADAMSRLAGPAYLTNAAATVYTVPALTTATVLEWIFANEDSSAHTITVSIGADAGGKRLWKDVLIPANSTFQVTGNTVLAAAEVIQAYADANSAVTLTMSGVLTT